MALLSGAHLCQPVDSHEDEELEDNPEVSPVDADPLVLLGLRAPHATGELEDQDGVEEDVGGEKGEEGQVEVDQLWPVLGQEAAPFQTWVKAPVLLAQHLHQGGAQDHGPRHTETETPGPGPLPGLPHSDISSVYTGVRLFRYTSDCLQILKVVYHRQICTVHQSFRLMSDPTLFARNWRGGPRERLAGVQGQGQQINHGSDVSSSYTVEEKEEF